MELDERNLRVNMKGDDVKQLQQALRQLGLEIKGEEGRFGKATIQAVRTFQKDHKLEPTGEVDENTANLIRDALAQKAERREDVRPFAITGRVIARASRRGISGLRIEAWDNDWICLI